MVQLVGKSAYARWMDDQCMGVSSRAEGLGVLAEVGTSLTTLHLTPAAKKSMVLPLSQVRRHFHLDLNRVLDRVDGLPHQSTRQEAIIRSQIRALWAKARKYEGVGEWDKVLKRLYRLAGLSRSRFLTISDGVI